jgi:hypothetical protein
MSNWDICFKIQSNFFFGQLQEIYTVYQETVLLV